MIASNKYLNGNAGISFGYKGGGSLLVLTRWLEYFEGKYCLKPFLGCSCCSFGFMVEVTARRIPGLSNVVCLWVCIGILVRISSTEPKQELH